MTESSDEDRDFRRKFMTTDPNRHKYEGRDEFVAKTESDRRSQWFPVIEMASQIISKARGYEMPKLEVKGSVAVGKAQVLSDLDLAVVVPVTHPFRSNSVEWRVFSDALAGIEFEDGLKPSFKIQTVLISEEEFPDKNKYIELYHPTRLPNENFNIIRLEETDVFIEIEGKKNNYREIPFSKKWISSFKNDTSGFRNAILETD